MVKLLQLSWGWQVLYQAVILYTVYGPEPVFGLLIFVMETSDGTWLLLVFAQVLTFYSK